MSNQSSLHFYVTSADCAYELTEKTLVDTAITSLSDLEDSIKDIIHVTRVEHPRKMAKLAASLSRQNAELLMELNRLRNHRE